MYKSERFITNLIRLHASERNNLMLRNNSGAFRDGTGRLIRFGLGNDSPTINKRVKSSDLIGLTQVTVTPDMVGKNIAVFTAIEVKKQGWKYKGVPGEQAQKKFLDIVRTKGGIAGFATSIDEYEKCLNEANG